MKHISLLIKPVSGSCNMQCSYCFYRDISENRDTVNYGRMSLETLEIIIRKTLETEPLWVSYAFQGGEPTLAGLDFYRALVEYQGKYRNKKTKILNSLQTNGKLIDKKWAEFLSKHDFLTGISLDGPKDMTDCHRKGCGGKSSFSRVMGATDRMSKSGAQFNILCVVTRNTARHVDKLYNFYKKNDFRYLQFIPCLEPLSEVRGGKSYSLDNESYAYFLKTLFDRWYNDLVSGQQISIRQFDNYIQMLMGHPPETCSLNGSCGKYFVIEADGRIYPCDFYVYDKWLLGNINDNELDSLINSPVSNMFIDESRLLPDRCKTCGYHFICRNGCKRDRVSVDGQYINYYCGAYKEFFSYAFNRMERLAILYSRA